MVAATVLAATTLAAAGTTAGSASVSGHGIAVRLPASWTGVIYQRSETRITDVTNGTSNTYLLGEKYLQPEHYKDGQDGSDNEHMYIGADNDLNRIVFCTATQYRPVQDKKGYSNTKIFGSAHVGAFNMLYCDGRVEAVSYDVDPAVHMRAGDRR